jgi:putative endonuclease
MDFYVYIIHSSSRDKYYIGYSSNPEIRLIEHNLGATPSTRTGKPWILVYKEKFTDKKSAIIREHQIKKMKSRKYIQSLISNSLIGPDDPQCGCQDAHLKRQN